MSTTIKFYNKNITIRILKFSLSLSLVADGETPLKDGSAQGGEFERPEEISLERSQQDDETHLQHGGPAGHPQPEGDQGAPDGVGGADGPEYLGEDHVVGQEHGDHHGASQQDVGPEWLGSLSHELLVIETEQEEGGEEGEETAVEDLGHQDHVGPVSWKISFEKS